MKDIQETINDLIDFIDADNKVEAENTFNALLQDRIDNILDSIKTDVAQEMFNTQECADCEENEEIEIEEGMVKAANKAKMRAYVKSAGTSPKSPQGWSGGHETNAQYDKRTVRAGREKLRNEEVESLDEYQKGLFNPPAGFTKKGIEKGKGMQTTYHYSSKKSTEPVGATMNLHGVKVQLGKKVQKEAYADPYAAKKAAEMKKKKDEAMAAAKKEYDASQESKGKIGKDFMKMKEEVEHIDELSKQTLSAYIKKAGPQITGLRQKHGLTSKPAMKRSGGVTRASINYLKKDLADLRKEETEHLDEVTYSAKMARAGKDIGKPGKMFKKIAAKASRKYGKDRGAKIAGAVLAKLRKKGK